MKKSSIWRFTWSHALGVYWLQVKTCEIDCAELWLSIYRKDEPNGFFAISPKTPSKAGLSESLALHVATF
jgi:hypothetical protein